MGYSLELKYPSIADVSTEESSYRSVTHSTDTDTGQALNVSDTYDRDVKVEPNDSIHTEAEMSQGDADTNQQARLYPKDLVISIQHPESPHSRVNSMLEVSAANGHNSPNVSNTSLLAILSLDGPSCNPSQTLSKTESQECLREKNESTTLYTDNGKLALYDNSDDDCSDISVLPKTSTAVSMKTFATSESGSTANIRMHHQTWTKEKQSTDRTYTFKYTQLDTHDLTETKKKPFQCPHCPASFSQKHLLKRHIVTHSLDKPFKCQQCPASFAQKSYLKSHILTHTGEKPFKCKQCPASFTQSGVLKRHLQTHTGEKPFKCKQCPAAFIQNSALKSHVRTHTGERPFKCQQCPAAFTQSGPLKRHVMRHTGEKPFKCQQGAASFSQNGHL